MKLIKVEVIDGSIHSGNNIYTKDDVFEIDEKHAKSLIDSKVAKEVAAEIKTKDTNAETKTNEAGTKDPQAEVFGKINEDLDGKNKDKK